MERLWAPWRRAYIRPDGRPKKGCLFCRLLAEKKDARNYILKRSTYSFAILNLYPYNNGHVMIVPNRHTPMLETMTGTERLDWLRLYDEVMAALQKTMKPHGFNVGMNLGQSAGAGVPGHLHLHIVPRWNGDTNFMPVLGKTKVISESLDSVYKILAADLNRTRKK